MFGLGSMIYGLAILGGLLGEPALLVEALSACRLLDPAELRKEDRLDVMFGLAGLLLALLALDRVLASSPLAGEAADGLPVELAAACAGRLMTLRGAGPPAGALTTPGYSHGASGVAHALTAFAARTGDRGAREEAGALLAGAERELAASGSRSGSWCNGLAGHAVARLAAANGDRSAGPPSALLDELESTPAAHDHLCCGWSGRADVLLHAARERGAPELRAAARRIGAGLLERHRHATLRFPHPEIRFEPRLLRGPIGVGYAFLRLSDPDSLPCLLAFE
jgi:lantibiotic modifying enzyme